MAKYLVEGLGADVNKKLRLVEVLKPDIECSVVAIAVKNGDVQMLRLLCQNLGARINDQIRIDGKPTTTVHFALQLIHQ